MSTMTLENDDGDTSTFYYPSGVSNRRRCDARDCSGVVRADEGCVVGYEHGGSHGESFYCRQCCRTKACAQLAGLPSLLESSQ